MNGGKNQTNLIEVAVGGGGVQVQGLLLLIGRADQQVIKDLVVPLVLGLEADARLLQQIILD